MMPNRGELELITGETDPCKRRRRILIAKGVKIVAVKLGDDGCYVTNGANEYQIEAFKVKVVDTTGAGDAFCAGFLYGLLKNKSLLECGKIGELRRFKMRNENGGPRRLALRQRFRASSLSGQASFRR